jgi:hypothetical protein
MRNFDFYEFTGILVPGVVTAYICSLLFPELANFTDGKGLTVGDLGFVAILAYACGHMIAGVGVLVEKLHWSIMGGMPTDWVRNQRKTFLAPEQTENLEQKIQALLSLPEPKRMSAWNPKNWFPVTRQIHAAVEKHGNAARIHTFNGNYGMFRGLSAGLLICIAVAKFSPYATPLGWSILVSCTILSLARMHRFGKHYARELFVQFLQINPQESKT